MRTEGALQTTDLHRLTGGQTLLVLAACPGDESAACGLLIAEACARSRPPLVVILTDGAHRGETDLPPDERAVAHERETRAAVSALKLPRNRLLLLGVHDGAVPAEGAFFDDLAGAIGFLTWMRDLNVVCGPREDDSRPDHAHGGAIAAAVARRCGIGLLSYGDGAGMVALDAPRHAAAKARAVAAHASLGWTAQAPTSPERFIRL